MPAFRLATTVVLWLPGVAAAQILSPGPLGTGHAQLEGISNCTKCHELGKKVDGTLCLKCHTEVDTTLARPESLHGAAKKEGTACIACHKDHRGRNAALSEWGGRRDRFDHRRAGYPLTGKHAQVKCEACHTSGAVKQSELRERLQKRPLSTYLGLTQRCLGCHADEHRGQLGSDCLHCHDDRAFAPASRFDHAKSFQLGGAHARAACAKCHPREPAAAPADTLLPAKHPTDATLYKPVAKACGGCHQDVHRKKFGPHCERCHGETSWAATRIRQGDIAFHQRTSFPLEGKHQTAACESCHPRTRGKLKTRGIPFARCTDCHRDAHFGQMPRDENGAVPCQRCHDPRGFYPPRFPLAEHQKGRYPLAGAHLAVACNRCHVPDPDRFLPQLPAALRGKKAEVKRTELYNLTRIRMDGVDLTACESCHRDPHGGQFTRGDRVSACSSCHRVDDFAALIFAHDRDTTYPLSGKHAKVRCAACHRRTSASQPTVYRGTQRACRSCHADPHLGQLDKRACADCHGTEGFKPARFNHTDPTLTSFPLDGKHLKTECAACHPRVELGPGLAAVWYRGVPRRCDGCHQDVHAGSTARRIP